MAAICERKAVRWLILEWRVEHDAWPTAEGWMKAQDGWPQTHTVIRLFGSWRAAIEDARKYGWVKYRERGQ